MLENISIRLEFCLGTRLQKVWETTYAPKGPNSLFARSVLYALFQHLRSGPPKKQYFMWMNEGRKFQRFIDQLSFAYCDSVDFCLLRLGYGMKATAFFFLRKNRGWFLF